MENEEVKTRVIFKKFPDGEVVACLLDVPANRYCVVTYQHVGQHSEGDISTTASFSPANVGEYGSLQEELESMGYVLEIRKKFPRS